MDYAYLKSLLLNFFFFVTFAFENRIAFRFIPLDYRRTKAFRASIEDLPSKYS